MPVDRGPEYDLIGRDRLLGQLGKVVDRLADGQRVAALVAGEAGIGKTSLLRAAVDHAAAIGLLTAWGTCLDVDGAPGYWPWTQALEGLVRTVGTGAARRAAGDGASLIASIVPSMGHAARGDGSDRDRLLAMDATVRLLEALAERQPLLVVIDDLQWADRSSLTLLEVLARSSARVGLGVIGGYRGDELSPAAQHHLSGLARGGDHFYVDGLGVEAVRRLLERTTGERVEAHVAAAVHHRTGGHPFFVRELALLGEHSERGDRVPSAVRGVVERRVARLPEATVDVLEATAISGLVLRPDVVAAALARSTVDVEAAANSAIEAGVLTINDDEVRFAHDLLREAILDGIEVPRRLALHRAIGAALEDRLLRGGQVTPSELARHFITALALDGPDRALRWAHEAAAADCASLAFGEAAGHLRRLRAGLADSAVRIDDATMVDLLVAEAAALAHAGGTLDARGLLRGAAEIATRAGDPERIARVALATAQLGARFAMRRDEIVRHLEHALTAVADTDDVLEARLTATLARELQHSIAEDRPRARPLSERALELGRRAAVPSTLLECLLARHDVLWVPGAGGHRAEVAREIAAVALEAGDQERYAEGLLLLANALLEQGSPAFEAALESCLSILEGRGRPRDHYLALTRRACVALLNDNLDDAAQLIDEATDLGERIREPDTGNVHMSQRLELTRARGNRDELTDFATEAVSHWTGAPIHAHAVAAGFLARAGELDAAGRHVDAVIELGTWRADRSYLWSVFVRELSQAAVAIGNRELCDELLDDLRPLAGSCGVNGALVAFAGSHAHTAGLLAAAVGQPETAELLLSQATASYRRLGAAGWLADIDQQRAKPLGQSRPAVASMRRRGSVWHLTFGGREGTVPHTKGLADIARLLAAAGSEIHALELADSRDRSGPVGEIVDRRAVDAYRQRLTDLADEADEAERNNDHERRSRTESERQAIVDELSRVTGTRDRPRPFANHPAERARKAVTARVRDAIRKLEPQLPELAAHLEAHLVTGTYCRYRANTTAWHIDPGPSR